MRERVARLRPAAGGAAADPASRGAATRAYLMCEDIETTMQGKLRDKGVAFDGGVTSSGGPVTTVVRPAAPVSAVPAGAMRAHGLS